MLVLTGKTNYISIWIFIINVVKGVSLSTHLKVVFYMKHWLIDYIVCQGTGCHHVKTELVKVLQFRYPTISYTDKLYERNKKTLLTQTTSQNAKIASQNQKKKNSPVAGYKSRFTQEIIAKLLCDNNLNADQWFSFT